MKRMISRSACFALTLFAPAVLTACQSSNGSVMRVPSTYAIVEESQSTQPDWLSKEFQEAGGRVYFVAQARGIADYTLAIHAAEREVIRTIAFQASSQVSATMRAGARGDERSAALIQRFNEEMTEIVVNKVTVGALRPDGLYWQRIQERDETGPAYLYNAAVRRSISVEDFRIIKAQGTAAAMQRLFPNADPPEWFRRLAERVERE